MIRHLSILLLVILVMASCDAAPDKKMVASNQSLSGQIIVITGRVSVKGPDLTSYIVIKPNDQTSYRLIGPLEDKIRHAYQNQLIRIRGIKQTDAIGPGFPAEISVIEIIEVMGE